MCQRKNDCVAVFVVAANVEGRWNWRKSKSVALFSALLLGATMTTVQKIKEIEEEMV